MACPYASGSPERALEEDVELRDQTEKLVLSGHSINYSTYLKLDKLLDSQESRSPVHDEHLFIVTHQAYELWFKQIIKEVDSVKNILSSTVVDEDKMLIVITRLNRVNLIVKLLCDQFAILETMTPLDFLEFRTFLGSSSGFQSLQFRLLENKLGLTEENRIRYNQAYYKDVFNDAKSTKDLDDSLREPSLLRVLEKWLERTPGLHKDEFHFWNRFKVSVQGWLRNEFLAPAVTEKDEAGRAIKMAEYEKEKDAFESILDEGKYTAHLARGDRRLSHKAFQGAMMISLYRDEPRFHQPFQLLTLLQDLDSLFMKWRYNHVMLVQRMIGSKIGTGGSSGYQYLRSTVSDRYKVFVDLCNLSTYVIPRAYIPPLTQRMKKTLSMMMKTGKDNGSALGNGDVASELEQGAAEGSGDGERVSFAIG